MINNHAGDVFVIFFNYLLFFFSFSSFFIALTLSERPKRFDESVSIMMIIHITCLE